MQNFRVVFFFIGVFALFFVGHALDPPAQCTKPLAFGKTCSTAKSSIRYHFDKATYMCMAFKHNGCGGNKNSFATEQECRLMCIPMGFSTCPGNTKQLTNNSNDGQYCKTDADCPTIGYCKKKITGSGTCCRKAAMKKYEADVNPKCAKGRSVVYVDDDLLIGKNCKSNFCPTGSNCKKGNFFATCCGKS